MDIFTIQNDPKQVVIDEISGQFIAMLGCIQSEKSTYMFLNQCNCTEYTRVKSSLSEFELREG